MTLAELDVIKGYPDGTFKPEAKITRAEFIAICARFFDAESGEIGFTDVTKSHWAYSYIVTSRQKGWITGYPDDTFRPNENIKRTEVVSIVNGMLGRTPDNDYIDAHEAELKTFSDVPKTHWNYYGIVEASNAHDAKYEEGKEIWE